MDYLQKISYEDTKNSWDFEGFSTLNCVENYLLWLLFGRSGKGKKCLGESTENMVAKRALNFQFFKEYSDEASEKRKFFA